MRVEIVYIDLYMICFDLVMVGFLEAKVRPIVLIMLRAVWHLLFKHAPSTSRH